VQLPRKTVRAVSRVSRMSDVGSLAQLYPVQPLTRVRGRPAMKGVAPDVWIQRYSQDYDETFPFPYFQPSDQWWNDRGNPYIKATHNARKTAGGSAEKPDAGILR
jgi:hypothetical protein